MSEDRLLTKNFLWVILINTFFHLNFTSFFLLPLFIKSLGGDEGNIGVIMGVAGFASIVVIPFTGSLIDKFGRKPFLLYGNLIMSIVALIFVNIKTLNIPLFVLLRIIQGFGFAFTFVSAQTVVIDIVSESRRAEGLGFFGVFTMATHALGPAIGEIIQSKFGFSTLFLCAMFFSIIALFLSRSINETGTTGEKFTNPFVFLMNSQNLYGTLFTTIICGGGFASVLVFITTYMQELALKPVSVFFLSYTIAAIITRIFLGQLADKFERSRIIIPSMFLYGMSILCLVFTKNMLLLILDAAVFGIAHGFIYPAMGAMVVDISGTAKGKGLSFYSASFSFGFTLSSIASGFITKHYGYANMFATSGLVVFMGMLIFYFVSRRLNHTVESGQVN
jgi:MFS family permease